MQNTLAIIAHPHPLYGGTMNNKVVHTVARAVCDLGVIAVRFNFRGVGLSEGEYDHGIGETQDLLAVADWCKEHYPGKALWLAGFSFGSYVAARSAQFLLPKQLLSIGPPVERFDFDVLHDIFCPWLVIQGDEDEVVNPGKVYEWVERHKPKPDLIKLEGAGHFFHRRLLDLRQLIINYYR